GVDDGGAVALGELLEAAEAAGDGGVGEDEPAALAGDGLGDVPGERALVEGAEDDAGLAAEEAEALGGDRVGMSHGRGGERKRRDGKASHPAARRGKRIVGSWDRGVVGAGGPSPTRSRSHPLTPPCPAG